jgi:hypothetical protein
MGYKVIAPVGDNLDALFIGMKEFATEKVYLITPKENLNKAKKIEKKLDQFAIETIIIEVSGNMLESMFSSFGKIVAHNDIDELIVNVATGNRMSTCAALSAAFANGLKAFGVVDKKPMILPIMKLSYYNELTVSKHKILNNLNGEEFTSLKDLHKKTKMSISLLSYHINRTLKYKGLLGLRLIEVKEKGKTLLVKLSDLGSLLLKGYIRCD